jgi:hypothetical protein
MRASSPTTSRARLAIAREHPQPADPAGFAGIAQADGKPPLGDADLRGLTNALTSLGLNEMISSDEAQHSARARR